MNTSLILSNILNPPVLFFFLGMLAIFLKSDLEISQPLGHCCYYGSISAVTFITAQSFLKVLNLTPGGHMVAALALMQSPAIIV